MNEMSAEDNKRAGRRNAWLAAVLMAAGLAMVGRSLVQLRAQSRLEMAQATGTQGAPLQATPAPQATSGGVPAESKPGGTRPTSPAPEPAQAPTEAQKQGVKSALPLAPGEKTGEPIKQK
jgi:hypothetical protein